MYMVLKWCGYETAQNYDGSWWEWSAGVVSDDLPIEP
jgi:3-mercaptopyruvate sulfurtransferase SseA